MIEFTGERVIPGQVDPDLWAEHISRYAFATRFAFEALVLDIGCGAGYGAAELASRARFAIGIDSAGEAIAHAQSAYALHNTNFIPASATALPFRDESFELVTAFEVIEHLADWRVLLSEARRVLYPDGVFLVSTPNKDFYTDSRGASGPNPFHTHEFEYNEFHNVLTEFFPHCTVLLQNHLEAFAFYQDGVNSSVDGRIDGVRGTPQQAHFFLAVCSLRKFPPSPGFLFVHQGSNVLREREKHIEILQRELSDAHEQFAALHRAHGELTLHAEEQTRWAVRTGEELEALRRDFLTLHEKLTAAEATVVERTLWAQRLAAQVEDLTAQVEDLTAQVRDLTEDLTARLNLWRASRWTKLGRKLSLGPDLDSKGNASGGGS